MKYLLILCSLLVSCGPGPETKKFFDNACKDYGPTKIVEAKVSKDAEDEPEASSTPEPSPTPPDYNNRCSEDDKRQIIADHSANNMRAFADMIQDSARHSTPAEIQVSFESASKYCDKLRACSGLPLEVTIPPGPGNELYDCGMRNGQNWIEIRCQTPEPPQ